MADRPADHRDGPDCRGRVADLGAPQAARAARALMDEGRQPAGRILGPLGATRHWSRARAQTQAGVKSQAVLYLDGLPVALASEDITFELCEVMAANWARRPS